MPQEKVAIITAGGSGMGAAAARRLAQDGFGVAILSSSGKGKALAEELGGIGVTGSNQSNEDLARLVDQAVERWGRIDALVNSAGHGARAPLLELTDDDWHRGMEVYFLNVVRPTRLVTPVMQRQKSGAIVNVSSFAAIEPDPAFPTSGVFRAGLAAYTNLFADRYVRHAPSRWLRHRHDDPGRTRQSAADAAGGGGLSGAVPGHPPSRHGL